MRSVIIEVGGGGWTGRGHGGRRRRCFCLQRFVAAMRVLDTLRGMGLGVEEGTEGLGDYILNHSEENVAGLG